MISEPGQTGSRELPQRPGPQMMASQARGRLGSQGDPGEKCFTAELSKQMLSEMLSKQMLSSLNKNSVPPWHWLHVKYSAAIVTAGSMGQCHSGGSSSCDSMGIGVAVLPCSSSQPQPTLSSERSNAPCRATQLEGVCEALCPAPCCTTEFTCSRWSLSVWFSI